MFEGKYSVPERQKDICREDIGNKSRFGMHFMDNYNYDLQRIRRCAVHYSAVDGRLYPFCTCNSGHTFRNLVEKRYVESKKNQ